MKIFINFLLLVTVSILFVVPAFGFTCSQTDIGVGDKCVSLSVSWANIVDQESLLSGWGCAKNLSKKINISSCAVPKCSQRCENGICTKPDHCECFKGFEPSPTDRFKCVPVCDSRFYLVENGRCDEPNVFRCNEDFKPVETDDLRLTCVPRCDPECVNANCSQNGTCICNPGYQLAPGSSKECEPSCGSLCKENQKCVEPEVCECLDGFEMSNVTELCKPICSNCTEECCVAPEVCECAVASFLEEKWVVVTAPTVAIIAILSAVVVWLYRPRKDALSSFECKYIPPTAEKSNTQHYSVDPTSSIQDRRLPELLQDTEPIIFPSMKDNDERDDKVQSVVYQSIKETKEPEVVYINYGG